MNEQAGATGVPGGTTWTDRIRVGAADLTIETGRIARLANGAVLMRQGDTMLLVTAVAAEEARPGASVDRAPLAVAVERRIKAYVGVTTTVRIVDPATIERSQGKAKRVVDLRPRT